MNNYTIKSVVKKIYSINYDNINLDNNTELIISKRTNDFHQLLYMNNEITNTHLIPYFDNETKSTQTGLFYKDNTIYNHPTYGEPLISFRLSLTGIKQGTFYRIRFITSSIDTFAEGVSSKLYIVLNGKDIVYNKNVPSTETNIDYVYMSNESVLNIAVTLGKISIKDIIFEEVEVAEEVEAKKAVIEIPDLVNLKAYAVLRPSMLTNRDKVITKFPLLRGIGVNVLYNRQDDLFIIERNKENDVIQENIGFTKYFIDVRCLNDGYITNQVVSEGPSPFSGYNGYSTFKLNEGKENTILYILIYELL
jgi:hypothetical protein